MSKYFRDLRDARTEADVRHIFISMELHIEELEKENKIYAQRLTTITQQFEQMKSDLHQFIRELAWNDVKYDAFQSTMGEFAGSTLAIPRYSTRYYDLWEEISKIKLDKIKEGEE